MEYNLSSVLTSLYGIRAIIAWTMGLLRPAGHSDVGCVQVFTTAIPGSMGALAFLPVEGI